MKATRHFAVKRYSLLLVSIFLCYLCTACSSNSKTVTVTLAGKEIPINGKIQTCIDNGLIITDVYGNETTPESKLEGREISYDAIRLGNSDYPRKSAVYVMCYNSNSGEASINDCSIMNLFYEPVFDNADLAPVLIDGIDFWGMTEDEALAALEEKGVKVDYDTMRSSHYSMFDTGKVSWTVKSQPGYSFDGDSKEPQKAVVDFDDNTYYISSIELSISGTLKITTK